MSRKRSAVSPFPMPPSRSINSSEKFQCWVAVRCSADGISQSTVGPRCSRNYSKFDQLIVHASHIAQQVREEVQRPESMVLSITNLKRTIDIFRKIIKTSSVMIPIWSSLEAYPAELTQWKIYFHYVCAYSHQEFRRVQVCQPRYTQLVVKVYWQLYEV